MRAESKKQDKEETKYSENLMDLENENKILRETVFQLKLEVDRYRSPALMLAEVADIFDNTAIIKVPNGNKFLVNISSTIKDLKPGDNVAVEQKNLTIVDKILQEKKVEIEQFVIIDHPNTSWKDIGGLSIQENELKEVIELPLTKPELFKKIGITPPKGVLLYGPPGTGKTLLAKAVASSTNSTFIEIVGSELVQKFIGEGAKLVKDIFKLARERAPSIIFIDEIDAIAAKRIEIGTSGEREVQRTFMQFLAEIDGFKALDNVKVIGCTNRKDILDPAILRPGRLDRLVEVPIPGIEGQTEIFKIHTKKMSLEKSINSESLLKKMHDFSGADIKSVCTEAGYFAIRKNKTKVSEKDFIKAINKIRGEDRQKDTTYQTMFG
ncbi:proteasome-activating nucleotidase [Candidatus Woesearchaeota archaeon]|nr:proteasome-activating nucleotidase [Candidatus Woesearchaeota archaeon]